MSPKEKAQGATNTEGLPTNTNGINFGTADYSSKAFSRLQAKFALEGHLLRRTVSSDGGWSYVAERWGQARALRTLDEVRGFLVQIGGTL